MATGCTPEEILALPDSEIVEKLEQDDDFARLIADLQVEIYQDDTLADVRQALMQEAVKADMVNPKFREKAYPLAYDERQVVDIRVRTLARVRCAVKRVFPDLGELMYAETAEKKPRLQNILRKTRDGDLAFRYEDMDRDGGTYFAGQHTSNAMFEWKPHFSPEFQMDATQTFKANDIFDHKGLIVGILAQEGELSTPAWKVLLKRDDWITYKSIWNAKKMDPAVIQIIMANEKTALVYRARTEANAQEELFEKAEEYKPQILDAHAMLARHEGLASETVALALVDGYYYFMPRHNRTMMDRFPKVKEAVMAKMNKEMGEGVK